MKRSANITPHTYLLEAIRNSSHNTSTATAEFIDNAIDADAENVWITFDKKNAIMYIADDGIGMTPEQLEKAVSLGSHENADARLGRFGVGLNTSASHLGTSYSVYSRVDNGKICRVDFNPDDIIASKKWATPLTDELTEDEEKMFNEAIHNDPSGTVIMIRGINRHFSSPQTIYQFGKTLMTNMGQMFRYFLPPATLGKKQGVSEEAMKTSRLRLFINGESVGGRDPLERSAPNTVVRLSGIIETPQGNIEYTLVEIDDVDKPLHYIEPDYFHQGVYVIREGREIMAHDKTTFYDIWGREHSTATHLRCEIRYPKTLDGIILVNHDKCGVKEVDQSIMDKLAAVLKAHIASFKASWKARRSSKPNEDVDKAHQTVTNNLEANANQMNLPNQRKADRKRGKAIEDSKKEKKPSSKPSSGEKTQKTGDEPKKEKVRKFEVRHCDLSAAGPAFTFEFAANNVLVLNWNTAHPFVQKYITLIDDSPTETIKGLDNLGFAIAAYWEQRVLEDEEAFQHKDTFLGVLSQNLRVAR